MWRTIDAVARLTFFEMVRTRLAWLVGLVLIAALGLAEFLSRVALTETAGFQAAVLGASLRAAAVFLVSLFVTTSLTREMHDKGVEMLLSLPVSRGVVLTGKLLGYGAGAGAVAALFTLAACLHAPPAQAIVWGVSLVLELWLVSTLAVLAILTLGQVPAAMAAVLGFYLLARGAAALQLMGHGPIQFQPSVLQQVAVHFIDALAWLLPDLHRFTRTDWLVYHGAGWADLLPIAGQSAIYLALLGAAAAFDLYRKNF